jgi:hypothetical protein
MGGPCSQMSAGGGGDSGMARERFVRRSSLASGKQKMDAPWVRHAASPKGVRSEGDPHLSQPAATQPTDLFHVLVQLLVLAIAKPAPGVGARQIQLRLRFPLKTPYAAVVVFFFELCELVVESAVRI